MEYAKFIKSHPLPEITERMKKKAEKVREVSSWESDNLYTAEVSDGMLVVTTYRKINGVLKHSHRHLYDGITFATQRISDGKKLGGEINSYLSMYCSIALDSKSEQVIRDYFPNIHYPDICALKYAEDDINEKRKLRRWQKTMDRIDQRMSCFHEPPQEFYDWIKEKLSHKHFFYSYKKGKLQSGYCSHCRHEFTAENIRHRGEITCPHCGSVLECLSLGKIKMHNLSYRTRASYVEEINDGGEPAIAERTFNVYFYINKFREGAENCVEKVEVYEWLRAIYKTDKSGISPKKDRDDVFFYIHDCFHNTSDIRWCRPSDRSGYLGDTSAYIYPHKFNSICSKIKSIDTMDLEAVVPHVRTEFYALVKAAAQVPALENLAKQGKYKLLGPVIRAGLYDFKNSYIARYISYTESSPARFLRVDKETFKAMRDISENEFMLYKELVKSYRADMDIIRRYSQNGIETNRGEIIYLLSRNSISPLRFINYLEKQSKLLHKKCKALLGLYRDYSDMVGDVKMERTESVIFPKDLQKEHDRLMKIKTDLEYSQQNKKLKKRGKLLHTLDYNDGKYLIVAFDKSDDFLNESAKLGHCVKTYIDRCSRGETNIYGIRKAKSPQEPYFTLTLDNNARVTQNLGLHNCRPPEEVKSFVRRWQKNVISKHKEEFISKAKKTA